MATAIRPVGWAVSSSISKDVWAPREGRVWVGGTIAREEVTGGEATGGTIATSPIPATVALALAVEGAAEAEKDGGAAVITGTTGALRGGGAIGALPVCWARTAWAGVIARTAGTNSVVIARMIFIPGPFRGLTALPPPTMTAKRHRMQ